MSGPDLAFGAKGGLKFVNTWRTYVKIRKPSREILGFFLGETEEFHARWNQQSSGSKKDGKTWGPWEIATAMQETKGVKKEYYAVTCPSDKDGYNKKAWQTVKICPLANAEHDIDAKRLMQILQVRRLTSVMMCKLPQPPRSTRRFSYL